MPRAPKFNHPIREVRRQTSAPTQEKFARLIGVSTPTIQAVENGKMPLSRRLAMRIERATGASHRQLLKGENGRAETLEGKPFSEEYFLRWLESKFTFSSEKPVGKADQKQVEMTANSVTFWAQKLIEGSRHSGETLGQLHHEIAEAMQAICEKHLLTESVEKELRPLKRVSVVSDSVSRWRDSLGDRGLKFMNSPLLSADTRVSISIDRLPAWNPGGPTPVSEEVA